MNLILLLIFSIMIKLNVISWINKNSSSFIPFLPSSTSSYSYEDLGLPSKPEPYNQVTLSLISNSEFEAIEDLMKDMDEMG